MGDASVMRHPKTSFLAELSHRLGDMLGFGAAEEKGCTVGLPAEEARRVARQLTGKVRAITRRHKLFSGRGQVLALLKAGRR